jgi:hypothetical protein
MQRAITVNVNQPETTAAPANVNEALGTKHNIKMKDYDSSSGKAMNEAVNNDAYRIRITRYATLTLWLKMTRQCHRLQTVSAGADAAAATPEMIDRTMTDDFRR